MSGLDKNRNRNQTICFRMSPEERRQLEARIKVCGMPKGEYFIQSLLFQQITLTVGKYQSDRLSLELRRLQVCMEELENERSGTELSPLLHDCIALLKQIRGVCES